MTLSWRGAFVLAGATLRGAARNRLLMVAVAFCIILVAASVTLAALSIGEQARLILDIGLASASAIGSIMAVALAVGGFAGDIERRTTYVILARPLPRWAFIVGRYLGLTATMMLVTSSMILATAAIVWLYGEPIPSATVSAVLLSWAEMAVVVAISLLFATLAKAVFATTYAVSVIVAGNLAGDVKLVASRLEEEAAALSSVLDWAYSILPSLDKLSVRLQVANNLDVPSGYVTTGLAYGGCYAMAVVVLAILSFNRREVL